MTYAELSCSCVISIVYIIVTVTEINGDEDGEVVTLSTQYLSQLTSQPSVQE